MDETTRHQIQRLRELTGELLALVGNLEACNVECQSGERERRPISIVAFREFRALLRELARTAIALDEEARKLPADPVSWGHPLPVGQPGT
jgi:hypothetical protein